MKNSKFISFAAICCSIVAVYEVQAQGIPNVPAAPAANVPVAAPAANVPVAAPVANVPVAAPAANVPVAAPAALPNKAPTAQFTKPPFKRMFLSKEEMDKLNLTEEQKQKWQAVIKERQDAIQPFFDKIQNIRDEQQKTMEQFNDKFVEILTPEQNALYQEMLTTPPVKKIDNFPVKKIETAPIEK